MTAATDYGNEHKHSSEYDTVVSRHSATFDSLLYSVDRASLYNSLLMTNLTHFFVTPLYMFRAS